MNAQPLPPGSPRDHAHERSEQATTCPGPAAERRGYNLHDLARPLAAAAQARGALRTAHALRGHRLCAPCAALSVSATRHKARHERTTRSDKYAHIRGATTRTAGSGHAAERHTPDTSLPHTHSVRAEAWASESSNHTAPLRVVTSEDLKHAATHTIHTHGKLTHHTIRRNTMRTFIGLDRVGCGSSP